MVEMWRHRGDTEGTQGGWGRDAEGTPWGHDGDVGTPGRCGDVGRTPWGCCGDIMGTLWGHHGDNGDKGDNGATAPTCWAAPAAPGRAHGPAAPQTDAAPRSVRGHQRRGDTGDSGTTRLSVRPSIRLSVCPPHPPGFPPPLPAHLPVQMDPGVGAAQQEHGVTSVPNADPGMGDSSDGGGGDTALGTPQDGRGTQWGHGSAQRDRGGNGDMGATWGATRGVTHRGHRG